MNDFPETPTPTPPATCTADSAESKICKTAKALAARFMATDVDTPRSLMDSYPNANNIEEALRILIDVLLPGKFSNYSVSADQLGVFLLRRLGDAWRLLYAEIEQALPFRWIGEAARHEGIQEPESMDTTAEANRIMDRFLEALPEVRSLLTEDIQAAYEGDPAALSYAEVLLSYPGILAIASHRLAHELYKLDVPIIPRIMSEWTHTKTGVDIHPGAQIGHGFFMDHATGIVIGETTEIGNYVKIYQGVTLGALSFPLDENGNPIKHVKRHPTVNDGVIIYANATILGGETIIGNDSIIGANVFLSESVPAGSMVTTNHPELNIREIRQ